MKRLRAKPGIADISGLYLLIGQFAKFGIVGVSNTLISFMIYYTLIYFGVHYIPANTLAFLVSVLNAYYWNSRHVFKNSRKSTGRIARIYASYGATFLLGAGLLFFMVELLGVSEYIAPVINLCVTVPLNFILNKLWVFRQDKKTERNLIKNDTV